MYIDNYYNMKKHSSNGLMPNTKVQGHFIQVFEKLNTKNSNELLNLGIYNCILILRLHLTVLLNYE